MNPIPTPDSFPEQESLRKAISVGQAMLADPEAEQARVAQDLAYLRDRDAIERRRYAQTAEAEAQLFRIARYI